MAESPRERATFSVLCSGRPNPFHGTSEESPSRKRQRVTFHNLRSNLTHQSTSSDNSTGSVVKFEEDAWSESNSIPSTPLEEATVHDTDHRKMDHPVKSLPPSPSIMPTKGFHEISDNDNGVDFDAESEAGISFMVPAMETTSNTHSLVSSPHVELLPVEDNGYLNTDPPIALIEEPDDDDDEIIFQDIFVKFPYQAEDETLLYTLNRLVRFFQFDEIVTEEAFLKLRDWIDSYLLAVTSSDQFYDFYVNNREFWTSLPEVIWALSHRQKYFGEFLRKSIDGRQTLTEMFCQFGRLTARFLTMDVRSLDSLTRGADIEPDLGSQSYLHALSHLLRKDESPHIGKNLEVHYQWNFDEDIAQICDNFQIEGGSIPALTKLVDNQLRLLPCTSKVVEYLTSPCRIAEAIIRNATSILDERDYTPQQLIAVSEKCISQGYEFFLSVSASLEVIIEKNITSLSPDAAIAYISCLSYIFRSSLNINNSRSQNIFKKRANKLVKIRPQDYSTVISLEWKFGILKKLITSAQMQLRVVGVTTMCSELLQLHHSSKNVDMETYSTLIYFAEYILEHKLVDYIVGVGSHPEIIHESGNILGFLIVTKTYKPQLTDTIWQTVISCQDQRVVDAILRMMTHCHNLYDEENLLHLSRKISCVPLEDFTPAMRELSQALFKQLVTKGVPDSIVTTLPHRLCERLLRESSNVSAETIVSFSEIQVWAESRFRELLVNGLSRKDRQEIYQECISDISLKSSTTLGSLSILNILLSRDKGHDTINLTTEFGLTKLLVDELESVAFGENSFTLQLLRGTPAGLASRNLLLRIIKVAPDTLTPELGERLWKVLVGSHSRSLAERNIWWQTLNTAVEQSRGDNKFLTRCFEEYLPNLSSLYFTSGALEFAREAVLNWLDKFQLDSSEEIANFESPALEQIWRMILTASSNTIDGAAISILVETYLKSDFILSVSQMKAQTIHLALVNRCLRQLKNAASKLKNSSLHSCEISENTTIVSENQFQEQERIFVRSLAVLREFLRGYHTSKPYSTTPKAMSLLPATDMDKTEGNQIIIKYQSFDEDKHSEIKNLVFGHLNTAASLLTTLQKTTGFKNYKIYCNGREFDPDEQEICKSISELNLKGLLLVKRCYDPEDSPSGTSTSNKMILESEIIKQFEDLWSYLGMHDKVAKEIYYFLKTLPVYDRLLNNFRTNTPYSEIFPSGQPFKSLYAIHGLHEYNSSRQPKKGAAAEVASSRAVSLIIAAISDPAVLDGCENTEVRDSLALQLIDCLLLLLKEPLPASPNSFLNENLLKHLLRLLELAKGSQAPKSHHLISMSFEAIIESSIYSVELWDKSLQHFKETTLLRELLLDSPRTVIRKSIAKTITEKCTNYTSSLAQVSSSTLVMGFWSIISSLISDAMIQTQQCEQVLAVSYTLFKKLTSSSSSSLQIEDLILVWGGLLISHTPNENVGEPESVDVAAQGLGNLLHYAALVAKSSKVSLTCSHIGTKLFRKYLFPVLSDPREGLVIPKVPLLNPKTRSTMAEAIFILIKDDHVQYPEVLLIMESLSPYAPNQEGSPYSHDLGFLFERNNSLRSKTGYVGLRNLSNTCYLNSLLTQLYMNIPFRSFMFSTLVSDASGSQRLLSETQSLFSYMQNSFSSFVDPTDLASSIQTYEETQIDVTVQMDVDEFYNLLFDRWESQIYAPQAKQTLRSFYGGQLVQQVKSKECPHVSELLEPFSAIQCDIKGKSCLQESLQAYVDGEVMEGDNKYKCTTCDRHVDAVKRACLKEIPDNLIFHLKRFDFNLRTLQRSKINDHFSFPDKIDMRSYKVEYLMEDPEEIPEDMFELVGILVHSGTAESGHYYSYIRERLSNGQQDKWIEFNDECVSHWDSACMEGSCFGGPDFRGQHDSGDVFYDKTWSAYMLFYQRCSNTTSPSNSCELPTPIRLPVPKQLSNRIAMENELLLRKYCLYDPSYSSFTLKMLQNTKQITGGCGVTDSHRLEKLALRVSLNHLDQVVSRNKDLPDFPTYIVQLGQQFRACAECSREFLEWISECYEALRQLLMKNPEQVVRNEVASLIFLALNKVKNDAPNAYGLLDINDSDDEPESTQPEILEHTIAALSSLYDIFHTSLRAWPEYFGLLSSIARMGTPEAACLVIKGFLNKTLDIITADPNLPLSTQYIKLLNTISKRSNARPIAYEAVISLLWHLMRICDASLNPVEEREECLYIALNDQPIPFTVNERNSLVQYWTRTNSNIFVGKLLQLNQNERATRAIITELLRWDDDIDIQVRHAIMGGIRHVSSSYPCRPFLMAASTYCEHSKDTHGIQLIIAHVSRTASLLENLEGSHFLQFFKEILSIEYFQSDISSEELYEFILDQIPTWAPCMLTLDDGNVRQQAEELIHEYLIVPLAREEENNTPSDSEYLLSDKKAEKIRLLRQLSQKLAMSCLEYLVDNYIRPRQTVIRANLVNIQAVIEACENIFDQDPNMCLQYYEQRIVTIDALKKLAVEEIDAEVSADWNNSDGEYDGSSEPMDSNAENSGGLVDEDQL
ncbi:BgTH12-07747 [Blumeria graminis f. sp. triticale]|nr:BgTH12-07747 [Blumeria graminis f. sp. triticale]